MVHSLSILRHRPCSTALQTIRSTARMMFGNEADIKLRHWMVCCSIHRAATPMLTKDGFLAPLRWEHFTLDLLGPPVLATSQMSAYKPFGIDESYTPLIAFPG